MKNSSRFMETVETCHGDPRNPLSDDDIVHKFHQCADGVIGPGKSGSVAETVRHIEDQENVTDLIANLTRIPSP